MTKEPTSHGGPSPGDARKQPADRIDADPPYRPDFSDRIVQFRKLLAELIARRLLSERQGPDNNCDQCPD